MKPELNTGYSSIRIRVTRYSMKKKFFLFIACFFFAFAGCDSTKSDDNEGEDQGSGEGGGNTTMVVEMGDRLRA